MAVLYTSLDEIRSFNPCPVGWSKILKGQHKTKADTILFPLTDCLLSNPIEDVYWLLGKRQKEISICAAAARACADSVAYLITEPLTEPLTPSWAATKAADRASFAADCACGTSCISNWSIVMYSAEAAIAAAEYAVKAAFAICSTEATANYARQRRLNRKLLLAAIQQFEQLN